MNVAAATRDLAMVKWSVVHCSGCETTFGVVEAASENGGILAVEYLLTLDAKVWSEKAPSLMKLKRVANEDEAWSHSQNNVVQWHVAAQMNIL